MTICHCEDIKSSLKLRSMPLHFGLNIYLKPKDLKSLGFILSYEQSSFLLWFVVVLRRIQQYFIYTVTGQLSSFQIYIYCWAPMLKAARGLLCPSQTLGCTKLYSVRSSLLHVDPVRCFPLHVDPVRISS